MNALSFLLLVFCSTNLKSSLTQSDINFLNESERTTNLIIINDLYEKASSSSIDPESIESPAMILTLQNALSSNQLVLCTKSIWLALQMQLQNIEDIWNLFTTKTFKEIKSEYDQKGLNQKYLEHYYESIQDTYNKKLEITLLLNNLDDKYATFADEQTIHEQTIHKDKISAGYLAQKIILARNYICKEVNQDFLLFIPQNQIKNFTNPLMSEIFLGLSFNNFQNYPYQNKTTDVFYKNFLKTINSYSIQTLGEKLLDSLKKISQNNKYFNQSLFPFFNIFLTGHGSVNTQTAAISIVLHPKTPKQSPSSDFLRILEFLRNQIRTKSLTIQSCFSGGKKAITTFNITNQFNNFNLEQINYPIIFTGSFLAYAHMLFASENYLNNDFTKYFHELNKTPPNYKNAANILSNIYSTTFTIQTIKKNYVSIKFPNASWYTPMEFELKTQTIPQIKASASFNINISNVAKIILLSANIIPGTLFFNEKIKDFPLIFPMNYHNQNYIISNITAQGINIQTEKKLHNRMKLLLPIPTIEEPINLVIKHLTSQAQYFKNIYIFTQNNQLLADLRITSEYSFVSGYTFTDQTNVTKIVYWQSSLDFPSFENATTATIDSTKIISWIEKIEKEASKNLKTFTNLELMLKSKTINPIPNIVQKSKMTHEALNQLKITASQITPPQSKNSAQTWFNAYHSILKEYFIINKILNPTTIDTKNAFKELNIQIPAPLISSINDLLIGKKPTMEAIKTFMNFQSDTIILKALDIAKNVLKTNKP